MIPYIEESRKSPRERVMKMQRTTSRYDISRTKVILSATKGTRDRFFTLAKMYGVTGNFLFELIVSEMFYEPIDAKTLPRLLEKTEERTHSFLMKHHPMR